MLQSFIAESPVHQRKKFVHATSDNHVNEPCPGTRAVPVEPLPPSNARYQRADPKAAGYSKPIPVVWRYPTPVAQLPKQSGKLPRLNMRKVGAAGDPQTSR